MKNHSLKSKRGFTLVEIICVVVLMGILGAVGLAFMRDSSQTGRLNAGRSNARELNSAFENLRAASAIFSTGTLTLTTGSASTAASITLPAAPAAADISTIITQLRGTGLMSFGNTASITANGVLTAASYTYTLDANSFPTFTFTGTNP